MGRGNITGKNNSFRTKFQIEIPNGTKKKINVGVSEGYTTLISEDDNVKSETNFNYKLPIKNGMLLEIL